MNEKVLCVIRLPASMNGTLLSVQSSFFQGGHPSQFAQAQRCSSHIYVISRSTVVTGLAAAVRAMTTFLAFEAPTGIGDVWSDLNFLGILLLLLRAECWSFI